MNQGSDVMTGNGCERGTGRVPARRRRPETGEVVGTPAGVRGTSGADPECLGPRTRGSYPRERGSTTPDRFTLDPVLSTTRHQHSGRDSTGTGDFRGGPDPDGIEVHHRYVFILVLVSPPDAFPRLGVRGFSPEVCE